MINKYVEILKDLNFNPTVILEIGSRDGHDAHYFKEQFNIENKDVYIVEPNPLMVTTIKEQYPNYTVFDVAISSTEGTAEFNQVIGGGMNPIGVSSLLIRTDNFYDRFETNKITVKTVKGSSILDSINKDIDICKIDVEGLTYEVLESFGESINKIKSFHLETEHVMLWENQKLHNDVCELMDKLGYSMVWQDDNQTQSDTVWAHTSLLMN
jgi:FkbM family methyltransferase